MFEQPVNAPSSVEETAESTVETLPLQPGRRLGEFLITRVVGQGGFGIVYEAEDLALQRRIAIKEYMPSQLATRIDGVKVHPISSRYARTFELGRKSFIAEARLLAQFRHPGLLEVLHFWSQNGTAYMAMPFYEGRTLDKVLATSRGVISEKWLGAMIGPVLDALEHMHGEDCYHRDVSADNILIREDGRALLLDLGAARHVIGDCERALTMMLKPGYAPIEQYADDPACRQGPWTDIYAVSAVLYFAITAKMPPASASRVMHDSLPPLATLRPAGYGQHFLEAIDRGMSIRPEHRPRTVGEFRSLLFRASLNEVPASRAGAHARDAAADAGRPLPAERSRQEGRSRAHGTTRAQGIARAEGATRAQDGVPAESASAAMRSRKRPLSRGERNVPLFAAAAVVCAVVVAWMSWPTGRTAATGEGRDAKLARQVEAAPAQRNNSTSAQRNDATPASQAGKPVATEPAAPRSAGGPAAPAVVGATSQQTVGGETQSRVAAAPLQDPSGTISPAPAKRPAASASSARTTRPSGKASTAAAERPKQGAASSAARAAAGADAKASSGADEGAVQPSGKTGSLRLSVAPWGEVFVNGSSRGVTPPLKQIVLSAGTHRVEIRNPAGPSWSKEIVVRAGQQEVVSHRFP